MRVERRRLGLSLKAEAESGLSGLSSITHTGVSRDDNDAKAQRSGTVGHPVRLGCHIRAIRNH